MIRRIAVVLLFAWAWAAKAQPLGLDLDLDAAASLAAPPAGAERAASVRLSASWTDVERESGVYDWSRIDPVVESLHAGGRGIVLALSGGNGLYDEAHRLEGFTAFVRSAVRTFAGRIEAIELGEGPRPGVDTAVEAFALKSAALAARAEAKAAGAALRVVQGAVRGEDLEAQKALWGNDTAAYVDVLPIRVTAGADVESVVGAFLAESALHPPAPAIWVYAEGIPDGVRALASSAAEAFCRPEGQGAARWVDGFDGDLDPEFAPAPEGSIALRTVDGAEHEGYRILGRFLHQKDYRTIVVYDAPLEGADRRTQPQARLVLDTIDVKDPRILDPFNGAELKTGSAPTPGISKPTIALVREDHPLLVVWERAAANQPGLELAPQDLRVQSTRGLTAEEIIARNQQVQKVQDDRLDRWKARGRLDYHFKLAQGGATVDVSIASNYFWERGGRLEWEQTDYFINGNKVGWKKIPELPIVQPDKVATLPLDLTLDRKYAYRLDGEDSIDGRPAYVLAFEPADPNAPLSLYRGRVWIDKETFVRVRANVVQTALEAPVLSNEETDTYRPVTGPDGETYWMLGRIDGQQLWTVGGRNLVVRREVEFETIDVNPRKPDFEAARNTAYRSSNQMLADTDEGYRYLERKEDGSREVKQGFDSSQLFALAGALKDDSQDSVVPLGGVNWFDYDLMHRGWQANVFFAGVVAFGNFTMPSIGKTHLDFTIEGAGIALKGDDKVFESGDEVLAQRIRRRSQVISARLGIPAGQFVKFTLVGTAQYRQFFDDTDGRNARPAGTTFVLPADHTVLSGTLLGEFNRKGWTVRASATGSSRTKWEPWGLYDTTAGSFVDPEFDPSQKRYTTWDAAVFKEWYLPKFQKIRAEVNYLDGKDLDRFSRYSFSLFGDERLNGFAGTGVRFDKGYFGRLGYSFNLFNVIRLDVALDQGRTRDERRDDRWRNFTGLGLSGNVVGPWKTVISLNYGRALSSDLPGLVGKQEFLLAILKLF